jgi:pSer/pThr/pTyr-binding forkhead associated (FHA) protein
MYENEPTMMGQGRPQAALVVRQGAQAGMSFPLTGNQLLIGREEGLEIVLQDPESSRRHVRISWQGGQFVIEDLGSTNGTFVNGVQITTPQILNPGDSIGIGQTALVFQVSGAQIRPPHYAPSVPQAPLGGGVPIAPYTPPAKESSNYTQYALYGCGCLLLVGICALLLLVGWVLVNPTSFEEVMGIKITLLLIEAIPGAVG